MHAVKTGCHLEQGKHNMTIRFIFTNVRKYWEHSPFLFGIYVSKKYNFHNQVLCIQSIFFIQNMEKVTEVKFGPLENSIYLKPMRMFYKQDGKDKSWDIMEMHDGVAIIIYNITRKKLLFFKQFRPGVYYTNIPEELRNKPIDMTKYPASLGITLELCAGIVDKAIPLVQIAKEEVLEECGYDVPLEKFERLHAYSASVGISGAVLTMFYCEVTDDMRVNAGGGIEDEIIDVVELSIDECKKELSNTVVRSPGSVIIAYYWFAHHKPQHCQRAFS